ncbi:MAG: hypothetical protein ACKVPX_14865 [Myxococcaceae bacterium]
MTSTAPATVEIKRVGKSGQISLGRQYEGQLYQEETYPDGVIVLRPVDVLPKDSWLVRDQESIRRALVWADTHPPQETTKAELASLSKRVKRGR